MLPPRGRSTRLTHENGHAPTTRPASSRSNWAWSSGSDGSGLRHRVEEARTDVSGVVLELDDTHRQLPRGHLRIADRAVQLHVETREHVPADSVHVSVSLCPNRLSIREMSLTKIPVRGYIVTSTGTYSELIRDWADDRPVDEGRHEGRGR